MNSSQFSGTINSQAERHSDDLELLWEQVSNILPEISSQFQQATKQWEDDYAEKFVTLATKRSWPQNEWNLRFQELFTNHLIPAELDEFRVDKAFYNLSKDDHFKHLGLSEFSEENKQTFKDLMRELHNQNIDLKPFELATKPKRIHTQCMMMNKYLKEKIPHIQTTDVKKIYLFLADNGYLGEFNPFRTVNNKFVGVLQESFSHRDLYSSNSIVLQLLITLSTYVLILVAILYGTLRLNIESGAGIFTLRLFVGLFPSRYLSARLAEKKTRKIDVQLHIDYQNGIKSIFALSHEDRLYFVNELSKNLRREQGYNIKGKKIAFYKQDFDSNGNYIGEERDYIAALLRNECDLIRLYGELTKSGDGKELKHFESVDVQPYSYTKYTQFIKENKKFLADKDNKVLHQDQYYKAQKIINVYNLIREYYKLAIGNQFDVFNINKKSFIRSNEMFPKFQPTRVDRPTSDPHYRYKANENGIGDQSEHQKNDNSSSGDDANLSIDDLIRKNFSRRTGSK